MRSLKFSSKNVDDPVSTREYTVNLIRSDEGLTLETSAFRIFVWWPINIINSVNKTKFLYTVFMLHIRCGLPASVANLRTFFSPKLEICLVRVLYNVGNWTR